MKQNLSFRVLFMLMAMLFVGSKANAQVPYAVLSDDNTVLTFYYDNNRESRNGMRVDAFPSPDWIVQGESIKKVVFDDSFTGCTNLISTRRWFFAEKSGGWVTKEEKSGKIVANQGI